MTVPKSLRGRTLQDRYFPQRLNRKLGIQVLLQSVALIAEPLPDGLETFGNFAEFRRGFSAVRSKARKLGLNKAALPTVTSPREPKPAPKPKPLSAAVTADPAPAATALPGFPEDSGTTFRAMGQWFGAVPLLDHHPGQCRWIVSDVWPFGIAARRPWTARRCADSISDASSFPAARRSTCSAAAAGWGWTRRDEDGAF
jgi:hypothetical protein